MQLRNIRKIKTIGLSTRDNQFSGHDRIEGGQLGFFEINSPRPCHDATEITSVTAGSKRRYLAVDQAPWALRKR